MARIACSPLVVAVLAGCGPSARQASVPRSPPAVDATERQPDGVATTEEPSPRSLPPPQPPPPPSPVPPSQPRAAPLPTPNKPCPPSPSTTLATIRLGADDHTTLGYDLCGATDRVLAQVPALPSLASGRFLLDVHLRRIDTAPRGQAVYVSCQLAIRIDAGSSNLGSIMGASRQPARDTARDIRRASATCVELVLQDLVVGKVAPLMQRHVASVAPATTAPQPPSPSPTPTSPPPTSSNPTP